MKKILLCLFCLLPLSLFALPTGNPLDASLLCRSVLLKERSENTCTSIFDLFSLRAGYYGDYVYNRKMRVDAGFRDNNIHQTEIYTNAGFLALNVCNRIDIYGTLGVSYFNLSTPLSAFAIVANPNRYYYIETDSHFSYTAGVNGTLLKWKRFGVGADAKYFSVHPDVNSTRVEQFDVQYVDARLKYYEWQVSIGTVYIVPVLSCIDVVPYITMKWAKAYGDFGNALDITQEQRLFKIKNTQCFGYSIGLTLVGDSKWDITAEGRFYDELAFHFNTQFRF